MNSALAFDSVTVRFGEFVALRQVSFAIPEGAFVGIIGPNGSGKTTLVNVLLGLVRPDEGSVQVFGDRPDRVTASQLAFVPQLKTLDRSFPARAIELVVTGRRRAWPWRISAAERTAALAAMEQSGVAQLADRQVSQLSGGELQRVYLARCLIRQPRLIVLDEPAAGLDMRGEADMYHLLLEYQQRQQCTIMMITHDWEGARCHASHVILLDRGRAHFGAPDKVASEERLLSVFGHIGHIADSHTGHDHA